jgi:hypothetical protein
MSNPTFLAHLAEDRRLVILRLLTEAGGTANDSVLEVGLQQLGHRRGLTRDVVRADIDWLKARRLVASITERGLNVAEGHETVDGVKRPSLV